MIENTSKRDPMLHLLGSMSDGSGYITGMEAQGQRQLVGSEQLPIDSGGDEGYEALGLVFGAPSDDLFRAAILPQGWTKAPTDHSMWSKVVDEKGRERISIFYKAAFYDRRAFMRLMTVGRYVAQMLGEGKPVVTDDSWCTPEVAARAAEEIRREWAEYMEVYAAKVEAGNASDYDRKRLAQLTAEVKRLDELIGRS